MSVVKPFIAIVAFLLIAASCEAATTVVVRSTETDCNAVRCLKNTGYGSGVVIGKFADGSDAVLTCAHNLGRGSVHIGWTGGELVPAKIVLWQLKGSLPEDKFDAALLSAYLPGAECGVLSESGTDSIGVLTGFVPDRSPGWRNARGRYLHKKRTLIGVVSIKGESGGPVCDEQTGEVLGIQWGTDGVNGSFMTESIEIRKWIIENLGYLPSCQRPVAPVRVEQPNCAVPSVPPVVQQPPQQAQCVCNCKCNGNCGKDSQIIEKVKLLRIPVVVTVDKTDCNREKRIYRVYLTPKISGDNVIVVAEVYDTKNTEDTRDDVLIDSDPYDVLGGKEVRLTIVADDAGGK